MDCFENYEKRKGMWFWLMLSIGAVLSEEPELRALKSSHIADDFITSTFYQSIFLEDLAEGLSFRHGEHGKK